MERILLRNTIELIADAFNCSEKQVISDIQLHYSNAGEETITSNFQNKLGIALHQICKKGKVELAFQEDIMKAIICILPRLNNIYHIQSMIAEISSGLIAEISWHEKYVEAKTGGDFGIVIIQPTISFYDNRIHINRCAEQRGLLVQAKRKKYNDRWGQLTASQERILCDKIDYLSILRYEFCDAENKILNDFLWNTFTNNDSIENIIEWLKKDELPQAACTKHIITQLGLGKIGTSDDAIIKEFIEPRHTPTMIIKIDWKDDNFGYRVCNLNNEIEVLTQERQKIRVLNI